MRNIKLTIQYDGTGYAGWQRQKNALSIQERIETALKRILSEKVHVTASGRTDAGVHARGQVANFKSRAKLPLDNIRMALNSSFGGDIVISRIEEAPRAFNAQHDARDKLYRYALSLGDAPDPFMRHFAARCRYKLDIGSMRRAARHLIGRHDFKAFRAAGGDERRTIRRINRIAIEKMGVMIYINIEADGFLYNMARNIVGTLIEVGRGKFSEERVKEILVKRSRRLCGPTAPAKGLCLMKVRY